MLKRGWIILVFVFAVGFVLLLPSAGLISAIPSDSSSICLVRYDGDSNVLYLNEMNLDIIENYDAFSIVRLDSRQIDDLQGLGFEIESLETRTRVGFNSHVFNVKDGEPNLPPSLRISQYPEDVVGFYIVQFIGPIKTVWKDDITDAGGVIHDFIPDFNFIVEMDQVSKYQVEKMRFVRWVGIYQPAYKVNPSLNEQASEMVVNIYTFKGRNTEEIAAEIGNMGAYILETRETTQSGLIRASVEASMISTIANFYNVKSLSLQELDFLCNEDATWILETDVDGQRTVMDNGVTGSGELITVMDSELRTTHEMFSDVNPIGPTHRKIHDQYVLGGGLLTDGNYHGTHVCGTVLGDAPMWYSWNLYDGQAIEARLIFQDIDDVNDANGAVLPPANLQDGYIPSYSAGSRVHQNSWGGGTGYTDDALEIDDFIWNNKDYNICFAMGNSGSGANTLSEHPEAKNCISVGGTQNNPNHNDMYSASSRGYADDGRIKPTVLGVSQQTTSAQNTGDTDYTDLTGTSMACPDIAGQVGQIRQYFNDGYYPSGSASAGDEFNPSGALCRATLINGAVEITGTGAYQNDNRYPNGDQGWGRSKLEDALFFSGDPRDLMVGDYDKGFITGAYREVQVSVNDNSQDLEFTFAWVDYPGADMADPAIVNDLDLRITGPTGDYFLGNAYTGFNPGRSAINPGTNPWAGSRTGGYDGLNIEECALLIPSMSFPTGVYTIRMDAYSVPQPRQPYALVVTGGFSNAGPVVQLYQPNGGESLTGGSSYDITWNLTDREDNDAAMTVDLWLSTDSGASYPTPIASGVPNTGTYPWTVTNIDTNNARVKIVSADSGGLTSEDWSYGDFTITSAGDVTPTSSCTYSGASPTPTSPITIDWTATDDIGLTQVELFYQHNAGGYGSWVDATNPAAASGTADSGSWSFGFSNGPGIYDFYTRATDNLPQTEAAPGTPDVTVEFAPPLPYDIDLSGVAVDTWVFVSFPIDISGDVPTIFDDTAFGDGATDWDYVQWYDNLNKEWRSYSTDKPASINDMDVIDNTYGFWIHITINGGDFQLTTGLEGLYPAGTVNINLYEGWNLVGYPSATPRAGDVTLPAEANLVSVYDLAEQYRIRDEPKGAVTFTEGNAYWVRVTADCTWQVNP